jgi:hypothetical protein
MEVRVHSKKAAPLSGIEPVLAEIRQQLQRHPDAWLQQLRDQPGSFADLEKSVHQAFQQMADQIVAGLLAQATEPVAFAEGAKKK